MLNSVVVMSWSWDPEILMLLLVYFTRSWCSCGDSCDYHGDSVPVNSVIHMCILLILLLLRSWKSLTMWCVLWLCYSFRSCHFLQIWLFSCVLVWLCCCFRSCLFCSSLSASSCTCPALVLDILVTFHWKSWECRRWVFCAFWREIVTSDNINMTSFLLVVMIQTSDPVVLLLQYAVGDDEHDDNCAFVPVL